MTFRLWRCFSRDIAIFGELSDFSLLGGTSSILGTFLGGTSEKLTLYNMRGTVNQVWLV